MVTAYPAEDEVAILLIGEHRLAAGERVSDGARVFLDVYAALYRGLGLTTWPVGDPEHPDPCCADGQPPVDPDLVDRFIATSRHERTSEPIDVVSSDVSADASTALANAKPS